MKHFINRVFFIIFFVYADAIRLDDEFDVNLELIKHQPCTYNEGRSKWMRKLEFEAALGSNGPTLRQRQDQPQCYNIGGRVTVFEEFRGEFSIYLEMRNSANKNQVPELCVNPRPDGCGGFGSCLYCDACETLASNQALKAQILLNGKAISCGEGLKPGTYDNLELSFCLPEFDEILESQGLTKENFKSIVQTEDSKTLRSMGFFATVYVFDNTDQVKKLMQKQMKIESIFRKSKRSFFRNEPLPTEVFWSLPFNQIIKEQRGFVACHKIYGNVKIRPASNASEGVTAVAVLENEFSKVH